jgi:hypothetical protein
MIDRWRFVMFNRLKILLIVSCLLFFAAIATAETLPMISFNTPGIYAYDSLTETIDTVNNSMDAVAMPEINPAQTLMVYNDNGVIKVYDLSLKTTASIGTVTALSSSEGGNVANFTADGKILFVDSADYVLKKMDTDGTNIVTVATPPVRYQFTYFALSPDRTRIAIITRLAEDQWGEGCTYYTCNNELLYLKNTDGSGSPTLLTGPYLGDWNFISWKQDSQALLYYHHHFDGSGINDPVHNAAKYTLFNLSGGTPVPTEFSGGIWDTEENVCVFTKKGNLLSLANQKLYNGETGTLIADVSSTVPNMMTGGIVGWSITGEFYFANSDKSNFHRFVEPGCLYADFPGAGVYQYNGTTWSPLTTAPLTSMVSSASKLYADFTSAGLYEWNTSSWTKMTDFSPAAMMPSGSTLYAHFTGFGIYAWNGSAWTNITVNEPATMIASDTTLYAHFTGYGLYQYSGNTWTKMTDFAPTLMVTSSSTLYAHFTGYGIFAWNGSSWTHITDFTPTTMVTSGSTLYTYFPGYGLYQYSASTWIKITDFTPSTMVTSDTTLYTYFPGYGLYQYSTSNWTLLTGLVPESMVISGSALYVDFGSYGIYTWNGSSWTNITGSDPASMVGN